MKKMVKKKYVANAAGCLFGLQRHIARRPTSGNAKHIWGWPRRLFVFGGALVCIVCGAAAARASNRQLRDGRQKSVA